MEKIDTLLKTSPFGFAYHKMIVDEAGQPINFRFLEVNAAFERITGLKAKDIIGKTMTEIVPPELQDEALAWIELYGKVALEGTTESFEQYFDFDGNWYQVQAWSDQKGFFAALFVEITERKQSEELVEEFSAFQELIFANIPAYLFIKNEAFRLVTANEQYLNLYPESIRDEVIGTTTLEQFDEHEREEFLAEDKRAFQEGYSEVEETITFPNGEVHTLWTKKIRFENKKGEPFILGLATDITDRKQTEQALQESEARYKLALSSTNDGLWDWDLQTNDVYFSDRYYTQLDYEPGEFPMNFASWENLVHPDDLATAKQGIEAYIGGQTDIFKTQFRARTKHGDWKHIFATGRIVERDDEGNPTRMIGIHTDITPLKEAQEEQEQLQQEVIEAQQRALEELSTPIIPIIKGVIILPLVGSIDSDRARDLMRNLLQGISQHRAKIVIMDITGVPMIDTGIAAHLDKTIQAARLKGARTIITGMSDGVAETLVDLGIDWSGVETLRDLQTGLVVALKRLGLALNG